MPPNLSPLLLFPSFLMHTQVAELGTVLLLVRGMTCASCVGSLEAHLRGLAGVTGVQVNLMSGQAKVEHDPKVGMQAVGLLGLPFVSLDPTTTAGCWTSASILVLHSAGSWAARPHQGGGRGWFRGQYLEGPVR